MLHRLKKETTLNKIRDLRVYIGSTNEKFPFDYNSVFWGLTKS